MPSSTCAREQCRNVSAPYGGLCQRHAREAQATAACGRDDCARPATHSAWCEPHYRRWLKTGSAEGGRAYYRDVRQALVECRRVDPNTDCWLWTRTLNDDGYGYTYADGRLRSVHALAYELHTGTKLTAGVELDHLCRTRSCFNPSHLEPVTHRVNMQRAADAWKARGYR